MLQIISFPQVILKEEILDENNVTDAKDSIGVFMGYALKGNFLIERTKKILRSLREGSVSEVSSQGVLVRPRPDSHCPCGQAVLELMQLEAVCERLTSVLYDASLPRDPNHYKTGFWGRAQVGMRTNAADGRRSGAVRQIRFWRMPTLCKHDRWATCFVSWTGLFIRQSLKKSKPLTLNLLQKTQVISFKSRRA